MNDKEVQGYMGEENRTLTTEYTDVVVNTENPGEDVMEIPHYAIERMARFFLKRMQEEYMQKSNQTQ